MHSGRVKYRHLRLSYLARLFYHSCDLKLQGDNYQGRLNSEITYMYTDKSILINDGQRFPKFTFAC